MTHLESKKPTVLIIDDMDDNVALLSAVFSDIYDVRSAASGQEGIEIAQHFPVDLILLDMLMPIMDGMETCRRLKQDAHLKQIPVIFVTATTDMAAEQDALDVGGEDFITKPINIITTRARVRVLMERAQLAHRLEVELEKTQVTLQSIGDGVITTDGSGVLDYMNSAAERLTGWSVDEAKGMPIEQVLKLELDSSFVQMRDPVVQCLRENHKVESPPNTRLLNRAEMEIGVEMSVSPIRNAEGQAIGAVLVLRDVSAQQLLTDEISYQASHDPLTGLVNRGEFEHRLEQALLGTSQLSSMHSLLFIDLDQFKLVNDACGHAVGDSLLIQVTKLMQECVRGEDTFARVGGDEFGVLLHDCPESTALRIGENICSQVDAFRFTHEERRFRIGASIGLVTVDQRWNSIGELLQAADAACYAAKEGGRNRVQRYSDLDIGANLRKREVNWATRIADALDQDTFVLFAQKIVCSDEKNNKGIYCEILLRMLEKDGSLSPPGAFIPAAERFHMMSRIDKWVIRKTINTLNLHKAKIDKIDLIAINLSGQSLGDKEFHQYVEKLLASCQFDVGKLCFEVTETSAIGHMQDALGFMEKMHRLGAQFSLDDFGSGLSSFGYLKKLPVDCIKVDGQFVRNMVNDPVDLLTVKCIGEIAKSLGKKTVAEFVENEEIRQKAIELGIDHLQGYVIHKPEPFENLLQNIL